MKILVDMNLSPSWVDALRERGHDATHWSSVGDPRAEDAALMQWARNNGFIVLTHDLDFSALLAATNATGPSVIQVCAQDVLAPELEEMVLHVLGHYERELTEGALLSINAERARVRLLPLRKSDRIQGDAP